MKIYQIDAFAEEVFSGNPAAVMILSNWLEEATMQKIAMENNLAETAFVVKNEDRYDIRWFTPEVEVDLCGHATLAASHVLFEHEQQAENEIHFYSHRSGYLHISKNNAWIQLDFPADELQPITGLTSLERALKASSMHTFKGKTDYMAVFSSEKEVAELNPDFSKLNQIEARGIIVTAPGDDHDFISRFFAPQSGINEDPVTGSAHTTLIPYWSDMLQKKKMKAKQISKRGGEITCEFDGKRVKISGKAVTYLVGEVYF